MKTKIQCGDKELDLTHMNSSEELVLYVEFHKGQVDLLEIQNDTGAVVWSYRKLENSDFYKGNLPKGCYLYATGRLN